MRATLTVELYATLFSAAVTLPHSAAHELARFREAYAFDDRFTCHIRSFMIIRDFFRYDNTLLLTTLFYYQCSYKGLPVAMLCQITGGAGSSGSKSPLMPRALARGGFYRDDLGLNAASHELRWGDYAVRGEHGEELLKLFVGVFLVTLFAAAERKYDVDRVACGHELVKEFRLYLQVVRGSAARKLYALYIEVLLGDTLLLPLLFLLVAELVVAHDAGYGRVRERGYLDNVDVRGVSNLNRVV